MQIIRDRQALHRIPELGHQLPKTFDYLRQQLCVLHCQIFMPTPCCLCAWFDFGADDAVAVRSDADGLPIEEQTNLPFASIHPGQMHACGHDGHMAMLLELARYLDEGAAPKHNVLLIFQGAEETDGGAKALCDTGILEKYQVKAVFGMHLWPQLPAGSIYTRPGEMLSRSCEVTVEFFGRSAHVAKAEQGVDAMAAGVAFYQKAAALEKSLPKNEPRLLSFGKMESGSVRNAISGYTRLEGTMRTFRDETFEALRQGLQELCREIEEGFGCKASLHISQGYPPVYNDPGLLERVQQITRVNMLEKPSMITEDFSFYQQRIGGVFFFLGTGQTPALHAADFDFDPGILEEGAKFWQSLILNLP